MVWVGGIRMYPVWEPLFTISRGGPAHRKEVPRMSVKDQVGTLSLGKKPPGGCGWSQERKPVGLCRIKMTVS